MQRLRATLAPFAALALALLLVAPGAPATAANNESELTYHLDGVTVTAVNPSALTVTLSDGNTYLMEFEGDFRRLAPGDMLRANWTYLNGQATIIRLYSVRRGG